MRKLITESFKVPGAHSKSLISVTGRVLIIWGLALMISLILMVCLYNIGIRESGYFTPGGEAFLTAIPLIGAAVVSGERKNSGQLLRKHALYMAKIKTQWVFANGDALSTEAEEVFAQHCQKNDDYVERFCAQLKWHPIKGTPQECIKRASDKGRLVYIVSPSGLSKCNGNSFAFNLRPIEADDSIFYMKAKGITRSDGDGWGGLKIAFKLPGGVITQEEALNHLGKQRLLEILGYGDCADDIEFISKDEYTKDYAHDSCATVGGDRYARVF